MSTTHPTTLPGLVSGAWAIDPAHSDISLAVRHLMVSKVRGRFSRFEGRIDIAEDPSASSVTASIDTASIETGEPNRDAHLRSDSFLDVDTYPTITYQSRAVRPDGEDFMVDGDLTVHGVSRPVALALEVNGVGPDPYGGTRAGFSATAEISRKDFGIDIDMPLDGGGVVVGDKIQVSLEIEAILQAAPAA